MVNLGNMRHQVQLLEENDTRQRGGGMSTEDQVKDTVFAEVKPRSRRAVSGEGGLEAVAEYEVTIRTPDFTMGLDWAVLVMDGPYAGKRLEVQTAHQPEEHRGEFTVLICTEAD